MGKLLVTGGYGMVGSTIPCDLKFKSKDVNLIDFNQTLDYFIKNKPNKVIHCAGKIGGVGANSTKKGEFLYKNVKINTRSFTISKC